MFDLKTVLLVLSLLIVIFSAARTGKYRKTSQSHKYIYIFFIMLGYWIICMLAQAMFADMFNIKPVYFEYFTGVVAVYVPVIVFMLAIIYLNNDSDTKKYRWLYILPTILLLGLWTNDMHKWFYIDYSTLFKNSENGILFTINALYSYVLFGISSIILLRKSYMKSGFFSIQTIIIVLGFLTPLTVNILGAFKIIAMSVYISPILFSFTAVCFALAIVKFKALNVIPVAFKTIINTMSDAFVVLSDDGTIADLNRTFMEKFKPLMELKEKDNLFEKLQGKKTVKLSDLKAYIKEAKEKGGTITKEYHIEKGDYNKYFDIDIQPIKAKRGNEYIASLLLFRDITAQKRDIEIMTKNENLVILGELAGGIAHDINTPISAIKSGLLMLKDTVKTEDEKMLVARMDSCADKITNLVNSMRNQIRNIGSDEKSRVNIASVIQDTKVIVHNEIVKQNVRLNINIKDDINVMGNITKLSQVVTNLVMNAIQAYECKGGIIDIDLYKTDKNEAKIVVQDYAGGIPERIRPNIFKNILTTKGVSGTGFGLYLAYSVIKGAFGGEMSFETETGKGTSFYITIPIDG